MTPNWLVEVAAIHERDVPETLIAGTAELGDRKLVLLLWRRSRAWHELRQHEKVAREDGKVLKLLTGHHRRGLRFRDFDEWPLACYGDRLVQRRERHADVKRRVGTDYERDRAADRTEALQLGDDLIGTGLERDGAIAALGARHERPRSAGRRVDNRDRHAGQDRTGIVRDDPADVRAYLRLQGRVPQHPTQCEDGERPDAIHVSCFRHVSIHRRIAQKVSRRSPTLKIRNVLVVLVTDVFVQFFVGWHE